MSATRAASRLARRELRRRPGRTALVIVLIAVPVALFVVYTVMFRTAASESAVDRFAGADAVLSLDAGGLSDGRDAAALTPDQAIARIRSIDPTIRATALATATGTTAARGQADARVTFEGGALGDPLLAPRYRVEQGRLPTSADEVALAPTLAARWGLGVGDRLDIDELDLHRQVVGVAHPYGSNADTVLTGVLPPLAPRQVHHDLYLGVPPTTSSTTLGQVTALTAGFGASVRDDAILADGRADTTCCLNTLHADRMATTAIAYSWIAEVMAFLVLGVIISIAFTLGARRQVRTLGLVAANGGSPRTLRTIVLAEGMWAGALGAVAGLGLALVTLAVLWRWYDRGSFSRDPWWTVAPTDIVPILAIGLLAAVGSALLPARSASQLSVLQSLAGRRPLRPARARVGILGTGVAAFGLALIAVATVATRVQPPVGTPALWTTTTLAGCVAILAGLITTAQFAVAMLGRLGGRLRGSGRVALRGIARQRTRYGSVVAGVCATGALTLALATNVASHAPRDANDVTTTMLPPDVVALWRSPANGSMSAEQRATAEQVAAAARALGPVTIADVRSVPVALGSPGAVPTGSLHPAGAVATPELLEVLGLDAGQRAALDATGAAVIGGRPDTEVYLYDQGVPVRVETVPLPGPELSTSLSSEVTSTRAAGGQVVMSTSYSLLPAVLVTPRVLTAAGLPDPVVTQTLMRTPAPLTDAQRTALTTIDGSDQRLVLAARTPEPDGPAMITSIAFAPAAGAGNGNGNGNGPDRVLLAQAGLAAVALALSAFVVAVGLALAAADSRDERGLLDALGASPRLVRRVAGTRAATLAALGGLLAVPAGVLPVAVLDATTRPVVATVVPWPTVLALVVVVPAVIGLGALAGSAVRSGRRSVPLAWLSDE